MTSAIAEPVDTNKEKPVKVERPIKLDDWEETIMRAVPAVVAIRFQTVRFFDTISTGASVATGFVVDKQRGLILTNRHVVTPAPVTAMAIFSNHEEIPIYPLYRDPVHDFGIYRFDPAAIRFMPISEITLAPERARVGIAIRVLGNDAGEKLSILQSTLARLDRKAPKYGVDTYNDHNTFYYQAASGTSGGSSGSPVLDVDGMAIALNAGGKKNAASSFYLPLDRVVRALGFIQRKELVPRGTLQAVFEHENYDECSRLGLPKDTEMDFRQRFADSTGLLVVGRIVPQGPADGVLEHGDVVLTIDGKHVASFVPLEDILDNSVGKAIEIEVSRGGTTKRLSVKVQDMHSVTPDSFIEFAGGIFHPLSFQVALNRMWPTGGVYCPLAGYVFSRAAISSGLVVLAVDAKPTPHINAFIDAVAQIPHGKKVVIRYVELTDTQTESVRLITVDRKWFGFRKWTRNDETGVWDKQELASAPAPEPIVPAFTEFPTEGGKLAELLAPSLCVVHFDIPFMLSGVHAKQFKGTGVVVDAAKGLVVADRNTVAIGLGDARLVFANSVEVPATIEFLHPIHNFAVLRYDPALLSGSKVRTAEFSDAPLHQGDETWFVGLSSDATVLSRLSQVAKRERLGFPAPRYSARYRQVNMEAYALDNALGSIGGVLCTEEGKIQAFWQSFSFCTSTDGKDINEIYRGMPARYIADVVVPMREDRPHQLHSLEVEMWMISLSVARARGLPQAWVDKLEARNPRHQVLTVVRTVCGSAADEHLLEGDLLLAINDTPVTTFQDAEVAWQHAEEVRVTVWRHEEMTFTLRTVPLANCDTTGFVLFAGAYLQESYRELRLQMKKVPAGIYCERFLLGSPAHQYHLTGKVWIMQVNSVKTPDLASFLEAVNDLPDGATVRLLTVDTKKKIKVVTLRVNYHYWPTGEFCLQGGEWQWRDRDTKPSLS